MDKINEYVLYFRHGFGAYVQILISVFGFLLITYNFLIKDIKVLNDLFSNFYIFSVVAILIYTPIIIAIGNIHFSKQYNVESTVGFFKTAGIAKAFRIIIELKQGMANDKEVETFKEILLTAEGKNNRF